MVKEKCQGVKVSVNNVYFVQWQSSAIQLRNEVGIAISFSFKSKVKIVTSLPSLYEMSFMFHNMTDFFDIADLQIWKDKKQFRGGLAGYCYLLFYYYHRKKVSYHLFS